MGQQQRFNRAAENDFYDRMRKYKLLSPEETAELLSRKDKDPRAVDKLVLHNYRLVVKLARKFEIRASEKGMELLDLISEGMIGLRTGIIRFDPSLGYQLSTYVYWWVLQTIKRAIDDDGLIRFPVALQERASKVFRWISDYMAKESHPPSWEQVREEFNLKPAQLDRVRFCWTKPDSLNRLSTEDGGEIGDSIQSDENIEENCDRLLAHEESQQVVWRELRYLPPKQRQAVMLYYRIGETDLSQKNRNYSEVARMMGVSREWAKCNVHRGVGSMRKAITGHERIGCKEENDENTLKPKSRRSTPPLTTISQYINQAANTAIATQSFVMPTKKDLAKQMGHWRSAIFNNTSPKGRQAQTLYVAAQERVKVAQSEFTTEALTASSIQFPTIAVTSS